MVTLSPNVTTPNVTPMTKLEELVALARKRQSARWEGFGCIGDYHCGAYECDHVSPYTKSASNVDADLFVMLQDWSSDSFLSKPVNTDVQRFGYAPRLPTNRKLAVLLHEHFKRDLSSVYATNLFPFVKPGGVSSELSMASLVRAANEFGLPQVLIVRPAFVVCFGLATFNALRVACGHSACKSMAIAIASEFSWSNVEFWAQAHPGHFGQVSRNTGGINRICHDWQRMKSAFDARA